MSEAVTKSVIKENIVPLLLIIVVLCGTVYFINVLGVKPLIVGFITLELIALVWLGNLLVKKGVLKKEDMPYYYLGVVAFIIFTYGLIKAGYIPVVSSSVLPLSEFEMYAVASSILLGILFFIIGVSVFAILYTALRK